MTLDLPHGSAPRGSSQAQPQALTSLPAALRYQTTSHSTGAVKPRKICRNDAVLRAPRQCRNEDLQWQKTCVFCYRPRLEAHALMQRISQQELGSFPCRLHTVLADNGRTFTGKNASEVVSRIHTSVTFSGASASSIETRNEIPSRTPCD